MKENQLKLNNGKEVSSFEEFKEYIKETLDNIDKAKKENENLPPSFVGENLEDILRITSMMATNQIRKNDATRKELSKLVEIKVSSRGKDKDRVEFDKIDTAFEKGNLDKIIDSIEKNAVSGKKDSIFKNARKEYENYYLKSDKGLDREEAIQNGMGKRGRVRNKLAEKEKFFTGKGKDPVYYFNFESKDLMKEIRETVEFGNKHSVRAYKTVMEKYNDNFVKNHEFYRMNVIIEKADDPFTAIDLLSGMEGYTKPREYAEEINGLLQSDYSKEESNTVNTVFTSQLLHAVNAMHEKRGFFSKLFNFRKSLKESSLIKNLENSLKKNGCSDEYIKHVKEENFDVRNELPENFMTEFKQIEKFEARKPFEISEEVNKKVDEMFMDNDFVKEKDIQKIDEIQELEDESLGV